MDDRIGPLCIVGVSCGLSSLTKPLNTPLPARHDLDREVKAVSQSQPLIFTLVPPEYFKAARQADDLEEEIKTEASHPSAKSLHMRSCPH